MCQQMYQPRITLQIITKVNVIIDDQLKVIDRSTEIATSEIERCNFIIENQDPVMIDIVIVLLELFKNTGYKRKTLLKSAGHQALIDFCQVDIYPGMYPKIIMVLPLRGIGIVFEFFQDHFKFAEVAQVEQCVQHIVHAFYIVTRFNGNHQWLFFKQVNPLLCIAVIHEKILADKRKPAIALI